MPPIRSPVHPSQWDRVYGNSDGQLDLNERGIALTVETVREKHAIDVEVKTDLDRHPLAPFRAGATYRDEFGETKVRIYPGAVGMSPELIPYVTGHELGHVVLNHLDRQANGHDLELEAEWFAGRTLAQFGEDLNQVVALVRAQGGNAATHGTVEERIAAIEGGYREAMAELHSGGPTVTPAPPRAEPAPPPAAPAPRDPARRDALDDAMNRLADAVEDWLSAGRIR